ncbi:putative leucine-rich repeat domain, L domain-containing protein [Medicago truncatula]|uniref:Putative leucine-rich repeat domain, L domain-containing protein n=1 Tax=Medicago truncatula TaxID=3880 RepID=A0A396IUW9_MEDTR|nr:putative leucine-rich repeat domain, L domain-containing protein [Medicago truncatula]
MMVGHSPIHAGPSTLLLGVIFCYIGTGKDTGRSCAFPTLARKRCETRGNETQGRVDALSVEARLDAGSANSDQKGANNIAKRSQERIGSAFTRNSLPQDFDDQEILYETCTVSNASQLLVLAPKLQSLRIKDCESLDVLPDGLLDGSTSLKELKLMNCSDLRSIPYPPSLTELYISKCRNFELLRSSKSRENLSFIHRLSIGNSCDSLTTLTLDLFPKLKILFIWNCPNLVSFDVTGVHKGDFPLECFEIRDCPGLTSFPDEGFHTPNLRAFTLSNCKNLKKFPNFIASLTSLLTLFVLRCPHIECFPHGGLPSSLILISIAYCDKLTSQKEWGLENLKSLTTFNIEGGCIGLESFPEENLLPRNIISLHISNLKSLKKLDDKGFQQLNALCTLKIDRCDVLQYLPEQGLPSSLNQLNIRDCPVLTPRLKPETGKYWCKVAHIPHIEIDDKKVGQPWYRY